MSQGRCPCCGSKVKRTLLSAKCERCKIRLKESRKTNWVYSASYFIGLGVCMFIASQGKQAVLDLNPGNESTAMFIYLLKLLVSMLLVVGVFSYIFARIFAVYEIDENNT